MKILFASQNQHKREEISVLFKDHVVIMPSEIGIDFTCEETGSTYLENAFIKAMMLFKTARTPVLADDSGLSIPALGGQPGVHSARYGSENGVNLDSGSRNRLLLSKMENTKDRRGFFVCCMVLITEENTFYIAQETLQGEISHTPTGTGGFGYDPLFFLPEYGCTVAELPSSEKNKISHRAKAAASLRKIIPEQLTK